MSDNMKEPKAYKNENSDYKALYEKQKAVIDELEKWLSDVYKTTMKTGEYYVDIRVSEVLNKLHELQGGE